MEEDINTGKDAKDQCLSWRKRHIETLNEDAQFMRIGVDILKIKRSKLCKKNKWYYLGFYFCLLYVVVVYALAIFVVYNLI